MHGAGRMTVKKYAAAALTIGIAIGPASALDAGLGGKVGGLGLDAGVSAGSQGASVGVGASVGGVGGSNVGASVGAGGGSVSAGVSAGGSAGSAGGGLSTGVGLGADPSAGNGSAAATAASGSAATATATTPFASAKTARQSVVLPPVLRPSKAGQGDLARGYPFAPLEALKAKPGTPEAIVQACRAAILSAARPLGAVRVRAVSAGALRRGGGALTAPIQVRIDYAGRGGIEVRQAQVGCRLDTAGRVMAVL